MDTTISFLISAGIIAFGVWIVAGTIAAGSPLTWTLMGLLPVVVGLISLYQAVRARGVSASARVTKRLGRVEKHHKRRVM